MTMAKVVMLFFAVIILITCVFWYVSSGKKHTSSPVVQTVKNSGNKENVSSPLAINAMREKSYPGSSISIDQTLEPGINYNRYVVSYISDGFKIYGLLTIPLGKKPANGWPVILFNHGYIAPSSYSTVSSYEVMVDPLAQAGYIVFKPDYRGNGNSQGSPSQPYISPNYVTDSMNALAAIKTYKQADPNRIGVFGHSMGGSITLHELVLTHAFRAAEIIAGVVGNESDLLTWWNHRFATNSIIGNDLDTYYVIEHMVKNYGTPAQNPSFWNAIDPVQFISYIATPVQIQVGTSDEEVPLDFSSSLRDLMKKNGKNVDYIAYPGADHNLAPDTSTAMAQTVTFFNSYVK
jgi:dipeptidyl aminopeptidase/acylaminoacyl peptidase